MISAEEETAAAAAAEGTHEAGSCRYHTLSTLCS